ncbi:HAT family dimerization domain-containing protein [Mycena indigotica]|uniref:HAT family dimerization domain-containing protein n=1 Tax=Mycena indigotica TaxID=2126181 RepID=A0A8H6RZH5_9AGAR|nr:HAT family dimerization domain-containing protein [Mycena indigotica]KAF7289717.1 HAT family dimerization domain-containing protein [Mycena indigotica]
MSIFRLHLLVHSLIPRQIPHAFQQRLSAEKMPTLAYTFPAFEAMTNALETQKLDHSELASIVDKGLDKLGSYRERVPTVPAYTLAMLSSFNGCSVPGR